jgi:hypothetical protein
MSREQKSSSSRRAPRRAKAAVAQIEGRQLYRSSLAAGLQSIFLNPGNFGRLLNCAKAFEFYRFTKLRFRLMPSESSTATQQVLVAGYLAEIADTPPAFAGVTEMMPQSTVVLAGTGTTSTQTVPGKWVNVPRNVLLATPVKWYKTVASSGEDIFLSQGTIWLASSSVADTAFLNLEIEYSCEFTGVEPSDAQ